MKLIAYLILGLIAGGIAKFIMPGKQGGGLLMTMILGILGAMVGGFLGSTFLGIQQDGNWLDIGSILTAVVGALVVLFLYGMFMKRKGN